MNSSLVQILGGILLLTLLTIVFIVIPYLKEGLLNKRIKNLEKQLSE